jgi:hypothetical protein
MKIVFKSKKHLAKQLLKGRKFTNGVGTIMFDPDFISNPFRYVTVTNNCPMEGVWNVDAAAWEEVVPQVHQELIDAYDKGAEIEFLRTCGTWYPAPNPNWCKHTTYRIKPYTYPLYAHNKAFKFIVQFTSPTEGTICEKGTVLHQSGILISTDTPHYDKSCWEYIQLAECCNLSE